MNESERIETLIERLKSRKGNYQWGQKIQQWLHVEERDLIVKAFLRDFDAIQPRPSAGSFRPPAQPVTSPIKRARLDFCVAFVWLIG